MTGQKAHPAIVAVVAPYPLEFAKRVVGELGHIVGRNAYEGGDMQTLSDAVAARADAARGHDDQMVWDEYAALYRRWADD